MVGTVHEPFTLALPFEGRWLTENSPARRVPSHGTDLLGGRYAIDFVGVDDRRRTSIRNDWRTAFSTEPVDRFFAFGRPILAPLAGTVVRVHDGEPDHEARRSQFTLVSYALGQAARLREGVASIAGNYVVIAAGPAEYVALVHLRKGSLNVTVGDTVAPGQFLGECGNSGNSTQPHVHLQVMDSLDLATAHGIPLAFEGFREWPRGASWALLRESGVPAEGAVVEPVR
ncbi:M23 family metallopeptidase [Arthrobacter sp. 260]|uniref:M23 family metallopeptidase n=1 Tax=Arthrobacter sp. 260 TaxID=2735314 RepID=UPI001492849B|nr:M23 family metallopeptidase [Arthrobacter sp. 260]NOJ59121.1 M23 family metallopeptidase [Arthrobacter sp. 260]